MPGFYRFDVTPYLREILDCMDMNSPIREITLMKGVQIGATVGILENAIGYGIAHVKTAPMMLVTADNELAKLRMEAYITPMLQQSGLAHLIKSTDTMSTRKSGKTDRRTEWVGGGFLIPQGAQNANKLRSFSVQILLADELDGWPERAGKDGDPFKLSVDRTAAYEGSRKIAALSTPLVKGQSKIAKRFEAGDKRRYFVRCLACGESQTLKWSRENNETGEKSGIVWETNEHGNLVAGSVRYLCKSCGHAHHNHDKVKLLDSQHGAEWKPTAVSSDQHHRSYHLSALYAPVGMMSWESCVKLWLDAWDVAKNRVRDVGQLQVFYNNVLGLPFELRGEKLTFSRVSEHRRDYRFGEIPNQWAEQVCGSRVLLLTCAVDVHKNDLAVAVFGWCRDRRPLLIDYWRFEGDTEQLDDEATWGRLREFIERPESYSADDGRRYKPQLTLIDSGYRTDQVYRFCADYSAGVYPIKGQDIPPRSARVKEFSDFTTPMGTVAYGITVDIYKDRWSAALRRGWDGVSLQPVGHFNAPRDATDKQLKELTVEVKREKIHATTKQRIGFEWHRPSGAANELWDLLVYNNAALDLIAWDLCRNEYEMEFVDWRQFYELAEHEQRYSTAKPDGD